MNDLSTSILARTVAERPRTRVLLATVSAAAVAICLGAGVASRHQTVILVAAAVAFVAALAWRYPELFGVVAVGILLVPYTWSRGSPGLELLALPGAIAAACLLLGRAKLRFNMIDYLVVALFATIVLSQVLGGRGLDVGAGSYTRDEIEGLLVTYFAFRVILAAWPRVAARVPGTLIAVGGILSVMALWEELQQRALFPVSALTNPQLAHWAIPYEREGAIRTTATMGQPLALGSFLIIPLLLAFAYRRWRMFALIALGEATTLSRGPYLGAIIALVLFGFLIHRIGRTWALVVVIAVVGLFVGPVRKSISASFQLGTREQVNADYRSRLVNASLGSLTLWGHGLPRRSELYGHEVRPGGETVSTDPASEAVSVNAQQGAVGLLVWLGFPIVFALTIRKARRSKDLLLLTLATALLAEWFVLLTVPLVTTFQYAFWLTMALTGARLAKALSSPEDPRGLGHNPLRPAGRG
jgi:hypothetical protein